VGDGAHLNESNDNNSKPKPTKIMDNVMAVSAGNAHSMAITSDRVLWTWGSNYYGQLGSDTQEDNTVADKYVPTKIMENIVEISAGLNHSMAITSNGELWTWGRNDYGALGDGTTIQKNAPVKIMDDVMSIFAGNEYSTAIKTDGSLWTWGLNDYGQLGDGTKENKTIPVKIMENVKFVVGGAEVCMSIKDDGALWAWGNNYETPLSDGTYQYLFDVLPNKIMDNTLYAYMSVGLYQIVYLVVKPDGTLWAWGGNAFGVLGDGTTEDKEIPTKVMDNIMLPITDQE